MTRKLSPGSAHTARRAIVGALAAVTLLSGLGLSGCSVVRAIRRIAHDLKANKATIDAFTNKLSNGEATSFQATYVTTGASPATVVYAVEPPWGLAFKDTPTAGAGPSLDLIVNSSGTYSCSPSGATPAWSCEEYPAGRGSSLSRVYDFYTPAHWVSFLRDFALAAGFAGDKVSSSSMSLNGFAMSCVDFRASGVPGTSTICTTSQGILGYVKVASETTSFQIKSYSSSPQASLFELPPGAKVTVVTTTTTSPG